MRDDGIDARALAAVIGARPEGEVRRAREGRRYVSEERDVEPSDDVLVLSAGISS